MVRERILHPVPCALFCCKPAILHGTRRSRETFHSCVRKCKEECIYQHCRFQKTKLCCFSRRGVLEDQLCCSWGLLCFC